MTYGPQLPIGEKGSPDGPSDDFARFTNRVEEQALFEGRVEARANSPLPILMFHGVAGQGKTWLLRRLQANLLVGEEKDRDGEREPDQAGMEEKGAGAEDEPGDGKGRWGKKGKKSKTKKDYRVPVAMLDFDTASSAPREQWLDAIRQRLGVPAPRFGLAWAALQGQRYGAQSLSSERGDSAESWGADLAGEVLGWLDLVPGGGFIARGVGKLGRRIFEEAHVQEVRHWLESVEGRQTVRFVEDQMKSSPDELSGKYLLHLLAADLKDFLPYRKDRACRAVVFFDMFEKLKFSGKDVAQQIDLRERWIYDLWKACHREVGGRPWPFLQIVIAGRDRLLWDDSRYLLQLAGEIRENGALDLRLVGGLSRPDAEGYLDTCEILPAPLREAILRVSQDGEGPDGVTAHHAYTLGLCADTVSEYRQAHRGRDPEPEWFDLTPGAAEGLRGKMDRLTDRFLSSLDQKEELEPILYLLAAAPRFDREALRARFSGGEAASIEALCHRILRYSFVEPLSPREDGESGSPWYRLHPLMKEALTHKATTTSERTAEAAETGTAAKPEPDRVWETYWAERSQEPLDDAASLAWYHQWRRDPVGALKSWEALAESLRREIRMVDHAKVLEWWEPTGIEKRKPRNEDEAAALGTFANEYQSSSLGHGSENFARAVAAYYNVMEVYTREKLPEDWATTQNNLGIALQEHGKRRGGEEGRKLLKEAVAAYRAALEERTRDRLSQDWAMTQNNLGTALKEQGIRTGGEPGKRLLEEAVAAYRAALEERTRNRLPQDWAMTQNNLGNALSEQGRRTGGEAGRNLLEEAVAAYRAALEVYTREHLPQDWAMTQNNLGNVLSDQGTRTGGEAGRNLLEEAVAAYRAALEVRTREDLPQEWATVQNNLGAALQEQGTRTGGEAGRELLEEAVAAFRAALEVRTREDLPQQWATTRNNLGNALREWAGLDGENRKLLLAGAIATHQSALEVYTEEHFSHYHAIVMRNLLQDFALALGGEDRLHEILETGGEEALWAALAEYFGGGDVGPETEGGEGEGELE